MEHGSQIRPAPYRVADRKAWFVCDWDGIEGLAIYVRTDITNAEQAALRARFDEISGPYEQQWQALPDAERDLAESPKAKERELLARYVFDWNATGIDPDGNVIELAAPAVNGPAVFDAISRDEEHWITMAVLHGYYHLGKAWKWRRPFAASGNGSGESSPAADPLPAAKTARQRNRRPS